MESGGGGDIRPAGDGRELAMAGAPAQGKREQWWERKKDKERRDGDGWVGEKEEIMSRPSDLYVTVTKGECGIKTNLHRLTRR